VTSEEIDALVDYKLGSRRGRLERQLRGLAERLRPGEQLVTVGCGARRMILRRPCLVAVTDQRVLLGWRGGGWDELEHAAIVSVTDDAVVGEISLVARDGVHTLTIGSPGAADIVSAIAQRVGEGRVYPRAGGAEARRAQQALVAAALSVALFIAALALRSQLDNIVHDVFASRSTPRALAKDVCVDLKGRPIRCDADVAFFVVLGPRGMPGCPSGSSTLAASVAATPAARRELARWCIDVKPR